MEFWRVCHKTERSSQSQTFMGPYCSSSPVSSTLVWAHQDDDCHPAPQAELTNVRAFWKAADYTAVCGSSSAEYLQEWFDGYWDILEKDFMVRAYDVSRHSIESSDETGQAVAIIGRAPAALEMTVEEFLAMMG